MRVMLLINFIYLHICFYVETVRRIFKGWFKWKHLSYTTCTLMIFKTQLIASKTDNRLRQNVLEGGSEGERGVQRLQTHNASNQLLEDTSQVHHEKNTIWTKCASIHLQSFYRKNVSPCLSTFLHCHRRHEHKRPAPVTCNMAQSPSLLCGINSNFCPSFALKFHIGVASSSGLTPIPTPPHVLHLNEHFKSPLSGQLICHLTKCH